MSVRNELINLVYIDNRALTLPLITFNKVVTTEARFSLVETNFVTEKKSTALEMTVYCGEYLFYTYYVKVI